MKKMFRLLFIFVLVAVLPLSFVACKNSKKSVVAPTNQQEQGAVDDEQPSPSYVIDGAEARTIILSSAEKLDTFIGSLNDSELLKDNSYGSSAGEKTCPIFNYANYPKLFVDILTSNNSLILDKVYANDADSTNKYFLVTKNDTNTLLKVEFTTRNTNDKFLYISFDFAVVNGHINSVKISQVEAGYSGKYVLFSESLLDFKNKIFETCSGHVIHNGSLAVNTYFNNWFVGFVNGEEGKETLPESTWSYSLYEKFEFSSGAENYICIYANNALDDEVKAKFSASFGFLDAFGVFNELDTLQVQEYRVLTTNIFATVVGYNNYTYNQEDCLFVKNS